MQSLVMRMSEDTYNNITIPEPTMMRVITSTKQGNFIEVVYWFDSYLHSYKQIKWLGNIKTKINMFISDVEFVSYHKDFNYQTVSGEPFSLNQFSYLWNLVTKNNSSIIVHRVKLPPLPYIDTMINGDIDKIIMRELYQPMLIHSKNLYYYHSFNYEAVLSGINESLQILQLSLSYKHKIKLCESVYNNFSKELLNNPFKYKQKLLGISKELERDNRTKKLKKDRIKCGRESENNNLKIIRDAVNTNPLVVKPNGSYNVSAIATLTKLSRPTVTKLLKKL